MDTTSFLRSIRLKKLIYMFVWVIFLVLFSNMILQNSVYSKGVEQSVYGNISDWVIDEEHGYIYVMIGEKGKFSILRTSDLGVEKEISFTEPYMSPSIEIEIYNGKIYLLFSDIYVIDIKTKMIEKTIKLSKLYNEYTDFTIDENKIFYSKKKSSDLFVYNILDGTKSVIKQNFIRQTKSNNIIRTLYADRENNVLYITDGYGDVFAVSTLNYQYLKSYNSTENLKYKSTPYRLIKQGNDLFYNNLRLNSQDLSTSYGEYNNGVLFVKDDYVLTHEGIYDRKSFIKIGSYEPYLFTSDYLLDSKGNIYIYSGMNRRISKEPIDQFIADKFKKNKSTSIDSKRLENDKSIISNPTRFDHNNYIDLGKFHAVLSDAYLNDLNLSSNYARDSIEKLLYANIIEGDSNKNFNPHSNTHRTQVIKVLVKSLGLDTSDLPDTPTFKDVPKSHWAYPYVETAYKAGITHGISSELFGANQLCTREQIVTMFVNSLELTQAELDKNPIYDSQIEGKKDVGEISLWAYKAMKFAIYFRIIEGETYNTVNPKGYLTNQDMVVIAERFITIRKPLLEAFSMWPYTQITGQYEYKFIFPKPVSFVRINKILNENGVNILDLDAEQRDSYYHTRDYKFVDIYIRNTYPRIEPLKPYTIQYEFVLRDSEMKARVYAEQTFVLAENRRYVSYIEAQNNSEIMVHYNQSPDLNSSHNPINYKILNENNKLLKIKEFSGSTDSVRLILDEPIKEKQKITITVENIVNNKSETFLPYTTQIIMKP